MTEQPRPAQPAGETEAHLQAIKNRHARDWDEVNVRRPIGEKDWQVYGPNASPDETHLATVYWTDFADAIAHIPTDIAWLVQLAERQQALLSEWRETLGWYSRGNQDGGGYALAALEVKANG